MIVSQQQQQQQQQTNNNTPSVLTGVAHTASNMKDVYSPVNTTMFPHRLLQQVFSNAVHVSHHVHPFLTRAIRPVPSANQPTAVAYISPASGPAELSPELYLFQPVQTLHCSWTSDSLLVFSLNISPAKCILTSVQEDGYLNWGKGSGGLNGVAGHKKETVC
jgi:hypothetical protein